MIHSTFKIQGAVHLLIAVSAIVRCVLPLANQSDTKATGSVGHSTQREARLASSGHVKFATTAGAGFFQISGGVFCGKNVVLAERSSGMVHFFNASGSLMKSLGGIGQGPGEFQHIFWVQRALNGVVVYDVVMRRMSHFSCDGDLVRVWSVVTPGLAVASHAVGLLADGRIVSAGSERAPPVRVPTAVRTTFNLFVSDLQSSRTERIGSYSGRAMYREPNPRGGEAMTQQVLGAQSAAFTDGNRVYVIDGASGVLRSWEAFQKELRPKQLEGASSGPLDPKVYASAVRRRTETLSEASDRLRGMLKRMPHPNARPALGWYGQRDVKLAHSSREGQLWVARFGGVGDEPPSWDLLDLRGSLLSRVYAPSELDVLDATADVALVRVWDADDLEHVELRRIVWSDNQP